MPMPHSRVISLSRTPAASSSAGAAHQQRVGAGPGDVVKTMHTLSAAFASSRSGGELTGRATAAATAAGTFSIGAPFSIPRLRPASRGQVKGQFSLVKWNMILLSYLSGPR